jgi:hypothetical protein
MLALQANTWKNERFHYVSAGNPEGRNGQKEMHPELCAEMRNRAEGDLKKDSGVPNARDMELGAHPSIDSSHQTASCQPL